MPNFQAFASPHLTAIALTFAIPLGLSIVVRYAKSERLTALICYIYAVLLIGQEFILFGWRLTTYGLWGKEGLLNHLPFHICGVLVFLISAMLIWREQKLFEAAYFWGLVGTLGALIFPDLGEGEGCPSFRFFQYFLAHSGIIGGVLFATWGLQMQPTLKGLFQSFVAINLYMVIAVFINLIMHNWVPESNYMYVCEPPDIPYKEIFFFAPHPWYIPFLDLLTIVLFFLVYAPFALMNFIRRQDIMSSGLQS